MRGVGYARVGYARVYCNSEFCHPLPKISNKRPGVLIAEIRYVRSISVPNYLPCLHRPIARARGHVTEASTYFVFVSDGLPVFLC